MPTSIRLPADLEHRLDQLAARTGRTKASHLRQAIEAHLDELEDVYLADLELQRVREGKSPTCALDEVMGAHGLED